jgi:hypothetical protein
MNAKMVPVLSSRGGQTRTEYEWEGLQTVVGDSAKVDGQIPTEVSGEELMCHRKQLEHGPDRAMVLVIIIIAAIVLIIASVLPNFLAPSLCFLFLS